MSTLIAVLVTALTTGVVPTVVAVLSYRQASTANRRTHDLATRKVDQEAFDIAQRIYRETITTLEHQLASALARISELESRQT